MSDILAYSKLIKLSTFEDRFKYLKLNSSIGKTTFGFDRYINQKFYSSIEWRRVRSIVIMRDNGCDLGLLDYPIYSKILIHHMNPLSIHDICTNSKYLMDPEYLITVSHDTHNAIHYGSLDYILSKTINERSPGDTCPWKKTNE